MSTVRGSLGRLAISSSNNNNCLGKIVISSSPFSTFSGGGGGGRGRGRGGSFGLPNPQLGAGKSEADDDNGEVDQFPSGLGHGRGKPIPSNPVLPAFSSWMSGINPSVGRGRTIQPQQQQQPGSSSHESQSFQPKKPIFFSREDSSESAQNSQFDDLGRNSDGSSLLSSLSSGLPGAGRGKPIKLPVKEERPKEENRHIRPRQPGPGSTRGVGNESEQRSSRPSSPRLSREDAVKNAVGILSRGGGGGLEEGGRGAGFRGRGTRGGGRGRGFRGRGRGFQGRGGRGAPEKDDDFDSGLYLGDNADGEKLASKLGADNMNKLVEGFEEMSSRVLPSPMDDAYLDALHTNNLIEYEPEYLMGDFSTNPDIDEKPPLPLRDALEKVKPFLMAYEGIQSQEEWEKIMEETMEKVPYMKELIDIYSGPDRVTAKQQIQELERVAATLPEKAPSSVKRFTNRALLSLQSNPGWGFDKKCQFMDKLVWEVSQQYK